MLDCASLEASLNETTWRNEFLVSQVREHASICDTLLSNSFQMLASHILDDSRGASLVCLRPPLVLVIFNDNGYLNVRTTPQPSGEVSLKV